MNQIQINTRIIRIRALLAGEYAASQHHPDVWMIIKREVDKIALNLDTPNHGLAADCMCDSCTIERRHYANTITDPRLTGTRPQSDD